MHQLNSYTRPTYELFDVHLSIDTPLLAGFWYAGVPDKSTLEPGQMAGSHRTKKSTRRYYTKTELQLGAEKV